MSAPVVTVDIQNHIADVRLNRPEKMNALNDAMFEEIAGAADELKNNRAVRAVVLSGNGGAFCAGLDMASLQGSSTLRDIFSKGSEHFPNYFQRPGMAWKEIPVPVIAAMHGTAFGGGLQIALGADIRVAAPGTRMSVMEIKWGLVPDMSASQTLRDLVRLDVAKDLSFTGRIFDAEEALELGIVTALAEDAHTEAMRRAEAIAAQNPDAIAHIKYLFDNSWHGDSKAGLRLEERAQARVIMRANQIEAVSAQFEKRTANFAEREFDDFDELAQ
ncbi:MAG: crotonase/enoyl-CoA hydratase family protein [Gammaproteobacteria bacterium]|nr:crotonase/enoyl-CoA hydratase family protein [Gammaproteobacteria bacterium]